VDQLGLDMIAIVMQQARLSYEPKVEVGLPKRRALQFGTNGLRACVGAVVDSKSRRERKRQQCVAFALG
jgi:hypothetical protein